MLRSTLFQIGYFITFITVFFTVLFAVYGYSYDFQSREFRRMGVVTLSSSNVRKADIQIGTTHEVPLAELPIGFNDVPVGPSTLRVHKPGYHDWEQHILVDNYFVTELGNILLKPLTWGTMERVLPWEVEECLVQEGGPYVAFCMLAEEEPTLLALRLDKARQWEALTIPLEVFPIQSVEAINTQELLIMAEDGRMAVYALEEEQWRMVDPKVIEDGRRGVVLAPYWYTLEEEVLTQIEVATEAVVTIAVPEALGMRRHKGELWVEFPEGWQVIHPKSGRLGERVWYSIPSQVQLWEEEGYQESVLYTSQANELITREKITGGKRVLTSLSEPIVTIIPSMHPQYWMVRTRAEVYLCHEWRQEPCMYVGAWLPGMDFYTPAQLLLWVEEGRVHVRDLSLDVYGERVPILGQ